jgi:sterol desaturase/sphingolipid hydroxylase (fatty acid hydroxylase superfamily)
MEITDAIVLGLAAAVVALIVVELVHPAREFERVPGWRLKCISFLPVVIALSAIVPFVMAFVVGDAKLLAGHRLGVAGGTVVGILVSELVVYWLHRLHHRIGFLWRWIHQMHHSAERVDIFGATYFHPFEVIEGTVVGILVLNVVLGLSPEAAFLTASWQGFNGVFQHGNVRTPRWLGYIVQRPEAHAIHHERGVHHFNYANLPLWDIAFRTFRNPPSWQGIAGFYSGASKRTWSMLAGRDISGGAPLDPAQRSIDVSQPS